MGTWPAFKAASFCSSLSTRMTSCPRSAKHDPATSPTYPDPTTAICIRYSGYRQLLYQFSCGGCANHLPPHWSDIKPYVTTVTASAEATLGTRDVDRRCPKLQD